MVFALSPVPPLASTQRSIVNYAAVTGRTVYGGRPVVIHQSGSLDLDLGDAERLRLVGEQLAAVVDHGDREVQLGAAGERQLGRRYRAAARRGGHAGVSVWLRG